MVMRKVDFQRKYGPLANKVGGGLLVASAMGVLVAWWIFLPLAFDPFYVQQASAAVVVLGYTKMLLWIIVPPILFLIPCGYCALLSLLFFMHARDVGIFFERAFSSPVHSSRHTPPLNRCMVISIIIAPVH